MTTLPLSEAKSRILEIAQAVATTHERVQITKDGRDCAWVDGGRLVENPLAASSSFLDAEAGWVALMINKVPVATTSTAVVANRHPWDKRRRRDF